MKTEQLNEKIKNFLETACYERMPDPKARWSVTLGGKPGQPLALRTVGDNNIPYNPEMADGEIVIRSYISIGEASRIVNGKEELLEKAFGNMEWVLQETLRLNNQNLEDFIKPTYTMLGYDKEFIRLCENVKAYEIRLYTTRKS